MVEKKCQSNAKTSLCLPQRPIRHLRLLQNRDAPNLSAVDRLKQENRLLERSRDVKTFNSPNKEELTLCLDPPSICQTSTAATALPLTASRTVTPQATRSAAAGTSTAMALMT